MNKVIVTIVTNSDKSKWFDFELPSDIPSQLIAEKISLVLKEGEPHLLTDLTYLLEVKVGGSEWKTLSTRATLSQAGVKSGAYLRVQRSFSTGNENENQPIEGWRSLYQQQVPVSEHVHTQYEKKEKEMNELKGYVWKTL
ncbi:hypothetical protein EEL32_18330 [Brevibacillus laterosporus]|nr:hypothetical protein [Brevibacillus laterosporus]TPG68427.1 hypothetical protein EEL31_07770 [Brevibacillus laterosporus]TPG83061.1 hypothetical protein EEL32_18330 [Brevibacillus laterosporus]